MIAPQWLQRFLGATPPPISAARAGFQPEQIEAIEEEVGRRIAMGAAVGAVLLISRDGRIGCHRAFGWQDREAQIPMSTNSLFRVLSMTKSITCAAIMILVDEGKIGLEDTIARYLPDFHDVQFADGRKPEQPPKVWQLMAHSAGLMDSFPVEFAKSDFTLSDVAAFAARAPLGYEPGKGWAYSNGGINVLGSIIQKVTGLQYAEFVSKRLFAPIRMTNSFFHVSPRDQRRLTAIYRISESGVSRETEDPTNARPHYVSPENGLNTTAMDMWRFYEMIRASGVSNGVRVLSPKSAQAMVTVQTEDRNAGFLPGMGYGYGLSLVTTPNGNFRNHNTGTFGHGSYYQTHGWVDPVKRIAGMLFCQNRADSVVVTDEAAQFITMLGALD